MAQKKISKEIRDLVRGYARRLVKEDEILLSRVLIFGSQATGKTRRWSDVDLCIVSPNFKNPVEASMYLWRKRNTKEIMAGLEPLGFSPDDFADGSSIINEIKKTGVEIFV